MSMSEDFKELVRNNVVSAGQDQDFHDLTNSWIRKSIEFNYAQNFTWMGRPVIQVPQDIYAIQELIWKVKPDLIVETGIAHGGSLILSASMLALVDYCEAVKSGKTLNPKESRRRVLGVDIDIRAHNREAIEAHPMAHMIEMFQGSSIDQGIIDKVHAVAEKHQTILLFMDSNHTHDHVLAELEAYAPLTTVGSYCVVWDTGVEDLPAGFCVGRPWGKGNNPKTAVWEYLGNLEKAQGCGDEKIPSFEIDRFIEHKLMITASPDGFLRRVR